MKGKGLTISSIVEAATELVIENGYKNFSMRELAKKLHCKAASLYNHIEGIDDINREIGSYASELMNDALEKAVAGKSRDAAIEAIAYEYRDFVKNNYELYRAIMGMPALKHDESLTLGRESVRVIRQVVAQYGISRENAINYSRCFRAALHGYISYEMSGYYTATNVTADESFRFLIQIYVKWANQMEDEQKAQTEERT